MNKAEAIERILKGSPFTQCEDCLGTGKTGTLFFKDQKLCKRCDGQASYPDPTYFAACDLLGRPYPLNETGSFVKLRNSLDVAPLRVDKLIMTPDMYADLEGFRDE